MLHSAASSMDTAATDNTLYDTRDKNSPVPLFSVEGPAATVPNPRYSELQQEKERMLLQIRDIRAAVKNSPVSAVDTRNMERHIVEGTKSDRANIVLWAKRYHNLLKSPEIERGAREYWTPALVNFVNDQLRLIEVTYGSKTLFPNWEANIRKTLNKLWVDYKFTGIPPTKGLVRETVNRIVATRSITNNEAEYLSLLQSAEMWAWSRVFTLDNPANEQYWKTNIERWELEIFGAILVKLFYEFLQASIGINFESYFKAASAADKAAIVVAANADTTRLLAGVPVVKRADTVTRQFNTLFAGTPETSALVPVITGMLFVLNKVKTIPGLNDENQAVLSIVDQKLTQAAINLRGMNSNLQQLTEARLSALLVTGTDVELMYLEPANLHEDSYVLDQLRKYIHNDVIAVFHPDVQERMRATLDRDEMYEWFRNRSRWVEFGAPLADDNVLPLLNANAILNALLEKLNMVSPRKRVPLEYVRNGEVDPLRNFGVTLQARIVDNRADLGGPGGYEFDSVRTYEVEWFSSRISPNARYSLDGEISSRPDYETLRSEVRSLGKQTLSGAAGSPLDVFSPMIRRIDDYADGVVWCVVRSEDKAGKVQYLRSMETKFLVNTLCTRCGVYFSQVTNQNQDCQWKNPHTQIIYSGMHTTSKTPEIPTPYDTLKGVVGSMPYHQHSVINMLKVQEAIEARVRAALTRMSKEEFEEQVRAARARFAANGPGYTYTEPEKIVALEFLYNMEQRSTYLVPGVRDPNMTPEKVIQDWEKRFQTQKSLVLTVFV